MYDEMLQNQGSNLIYAAFTPYEKYKLDFVEQAYRLKSSVAGGSDGGACLLYTSPSPRDRG